VKRARTILAVLAPLGAIAALVGLSACPANPAPTLYEPITGVVIDSEGLTAGIGCGTADNQVFEYAAVATLAPDASKGVSGLPVSGVFPCYSNGQLANLPSPDGGTFDYVISIYAWNQASFPAAELGGCDYLPADASCQGENPAAVLKYAPTADWTTTCTVTQIVGISEVATCGSLVRNLDASLGPDTSTEAGVGDGATEGAVEAGEAGSLAGDSGEAGAVEGGMVTDSGAADGADGGGGPITDGGDGG
jgi:hypothetical protein